MRLKCEKCGKTLTVRAADAAGFEVREPRDREGSLPCPWCHATRGRWYYLWMVPPRPPEPRDP